jgi:hypothetical protein
VALSPPKPRRLRELRLALFAAALLGTSGCAYKLGANLMGGVLDEAAGNGRTDGVDQVAERLLEKELAAEIGHQLGAGLMSGATEITPEQRQSLEDAIDGLLTVAAKRTGEGLRDDVSPAMRQLVRDDIIRALSEGMRGELGSSLEETVDRVVTRAILSLRRGLADPEMRMATAEMLQDSMYMAMREGRPGHQAVGETLQTTLTENLLAPFEDSIDSIAGTVAQKVEQQAKQTERTLQGIIVVLTMVGFVFLAMFIVSQRRLQKEREHSIEAEQGLRSVGVAIDLLDDDTKKTLLGKIDEYRAVSVPRDKPVPPVAQRSEDYERKE